jgi:hypothetical protein
MTEKIFWEDLDAAAAALVRDTLLGENVERVAQKLERSPDLLYKAANPTTPQQLNLKQFLNILKITGNYRAVRQLAQACGFLVVPAGGEPGQVLRALAAEMEGAAQAGKPVPPGSAQIQFPRREAG